LSFDDLPVIEWDVVEVERAGGVTHKDGYEAISLYYKVSTRLEPGGSKEYYHDFDLIWPLNTNNLVYLNGSPLSGRGGEVYAYEWHNSDGEFVIYSEIPVKSGDVFTFDQSWFFLDRGTSKYKVRIITESITFEEDE
jgi:hypothetical protein